MDTATQVAAPAKSPRRRLDKSTKTQAVKASHTFTAESKFRLSLLALYSDKSESDLLNEWIAEKAKGLRIDDSRFVERKSSAPVTSTESADRGN